MIEHLWFRRSTGSSLVALILIALGAIAAVYGIYSDAAHTWPTLLLNGFYIVSLSLSAVFFLASQRLTGARWSASLRRIPEALSAAMPAAAVLMLVLYFGRNQIFPWTHPSTAFAGTPGFAGKIGYLREPLVFARMVVLLALWVLFAWLFRRVSLDQDGNPATNMEHHRRLNRFAALFALVFAVSFTLGAYDWIISLDPQWFSTMFAVYMFAGTFVQGIAAITLAAVLLHERGLFRDWITENQFHDLGKMLFAFSTFWAYIWVCQYLLIWYGNIPEEVTHYISRTNGSWLALYTVNFLINWILPFSVLLSAGAKRRTKVLKFVTVALLLGHWLDLYQLIMPTFHPAAPSLNLVDVFITAGYGALFYLMFIRSLAKAPLVPVNDPILCYSSMLTNSASAAAPLAALSRRLEPRTKHFLEQSNHEGL